MFHLFFIQKINKAKNDIIDIVFDVSLVEYNVISITIRRNLTAKAVKNLTARCL